MAFISTIGSAPRGATENDQTTTSEFGKTLSTGDWDGWSNGAPPVAEYRNGASVASCV